MRESDGKHSSGEKSNTRSELCDKGASPSKTGERASEFVPIAAALWKSSEGEKGEEEF